MKFAKAVLTCLFCFAATGVVHGKVFLLLDDRLKGSALEQSIYKFVPLTNATEVELNYVHDFMKSDAGLDYGRKLAQADRAIYIGNDRWPDDEYVRTLTNRREWFDMLGKISFLIVSNAPAYAPMPKGLFARHDLWRKYAEVTSARFIGFFNKHTLDAQSETLSAGNWRSFTCVHESGRVVSPGKKSPVAINRGRLSLTFRSKAQADFAGGLVCTNTPVGDTIFEVRATKTDVALQIPVARFSAWNEAQPLEVNVRSDRLIGAPLTLQVLPAVNARPVDFVFQGDKITCDKGRCGKKNAEFLMPQFTDFQHRFEIAFRGQGNDYFRGVMRLMAGEIEVARSEVKLTPHSWLAEAFYAFGNPSEYRSLFLLAFAAVVAAILVLLLLIRLVRRLVRHIVSVRQQSVLPRQSSVSFLLADGVHYHITASENPFGCELADFGAVAEVLLQADRIVLRHGSRAPIEAAADGFTHDFADGYRLLVRRAGSGFRLDLFRLSGKGSSVTSAKPSRTPDRLSANAVSS